jgi:hypothetical protein
MSTKHTHLDANESTFFARELESVKSKSYDVLYPELKARKLFPVSFEAGSGAESIVYEQYDQLGMAKIIASYADDLPRADIKGKEFVAKIKSLGASYGYSIQDIRAASKAGKPLKQMKANSAKRAVMQKENSIALFGDADNMLPGFLTNPNINEFTVPADGTGASSLWTAKTADLILRDMNGLVNKIPEDTFGVEMPDTLLLPLAQYNLIATKRIGVDSNMTVLKYFLETNPYIKQVDWLNELKDAGSGGAEVMIAYKRDPDKLTLEIPSDFEQFEEQLRGLEYVVPVHERICGVLIYYPMSVCFGEGI